MDKGIDREIYELIVSDPPTIRALAQLLDHVLNEPLTRHRREGFILIRFSHDRIGQPEYVTTCSDDDAINILKLAVAKLEGRIEKEPPAMPDEVKYQRHLGDGVYVSVTNGMVKLHTRSSTIWLEVETLDAFLEWLADLRAKMVAERETKDA